MRLLNLSEQKFGKLTVKFLMPKNGVNRYWHCECDCGNSTKASANSLRTGNTASCGKCRGSNIHALKHGHTSKAGYRSPTYGSWSAMIQRVTGKKSHYKNTYLDDPRWWDFSLFLYDMGERPEGKTLDRINNDKGYSKDNCQWSSHKEQTRNRKIARVFTINEITKPIAEWAIDYGISYNAAYNRIQRHGRIDIDDI